MFKLQKGSVHLFLPIVIFVVVTILGYIVLKSRVNQNITTQTASSPEPAVSNVNSQPHYDNDWKTYTNKEWKYSIYYPSGWKVIEVKKSVGTDPEWTGDILEDELQKTAFLEENQGLWQGSFEISVSQNPKGYNTESWAENYFRPLLTDPSTNLAKPSGEISIDNFFAKKFSVFAFDSDEIVIGIVKNNLLYKFVYTGSTPNDPQIEYHNQMYSQMLSSFNFLATESSSTFFCPESGWVDCMPGPDKDMGTCSEETENWYKINCPNYEGMAY